MNSLNFAMKDLAFVWNWASVDGDWVRELSPPRRPPPRAFAPPNNPFPIC